MDQLDISIIRALRMNPFGGPFPSKLSTLRKVASELSVSKDTVKERLDGLAASGVLLDWQVMLNPRLLSLRAAHVWLEFATEDAKEEALRQLESVRTVRAITDYFGSCLSFVTVYGVGVPLRDQLETVKSFHSPH